MCQLDLFKAVAPVRQAPAIITPDNELVLAPPVLYPSGIEAVERKAARLREIEDRKEEGTK